MNSLLLFISNIGNHIDTPIRNRNVYNHQCKRILTISIHSYVRFHYLCTPTKSITSLINKNLNRIT